MTRRAIVIGGGPAGIKAAHDLVKSGAEVTLLESAPVLGGLASAFDVQGVRIERYYHFICKGDDHLIETLDETRIRRLVREYFCEPPMILAKKVTLRKIARNARTGGWHQDGAFMGAGIRSLNLWLSLSYCGESAPGLDVVGRRLDELVQSGEGAFAAWGVKPHVAERVAKGAIERPVFEPGDALLLDHLTLHRTAVDAEMTNDRYAIETWLFAPSTYDAMTTKGGQSYEPRDQLPILL